MNSKIVKFSDFTIVPVLKSIKNIAMDDETYFSSKYSKYISNSRLKWIDPESDGSPDLFKSPPRITTNSLSIGSSVHEVLLQPDEFELAPKFNRPTAKLGQVIEEVYKFRKQNLSIEQSIRRACEKVGYYVNQINKKIPMIIEKGITYYLSRYAYEKQSFNKTQIFLSDSDHDVVSSCLESCYNNNKLMNFLYPKDIFGDKIESHCEDAFFIDFVVTYQHRHCTTLRFKLKADNWTIDYDEKVVTLNDLKTTSKPVQWFMHPEYGSMTKYRYDRQMACYSNILWYYCVQNFGVCKNQGWTLKANMLVVQTTPPYTSACFPVDRSLLKKGQLHFEQLMKRVAYYEIFGYEKEVDFC
ncbi:MAG: PD-(D/E)XK nuclease-like domain-containing protein [Methanobrevibacter sp.]|nr:PD-(D/E)XK nuclease-like domain-containing protein [Methanobrevibacter sp.]